MTLRIKRDGTAMWRGRSIGLVQRDGYAWLFVSETDQKIIPAAESGGTRQEMVNRLTRKIVANERAAR